jgi:hypothetical protein
MSWGESLHLFSFCFGPNRTCTIFESVSIFGTVDDQSQVKLSIG